MSVFFTDTYIIGYIVTFSYMHIMSFEHSSPLAFLAHCNPPDPGFQPAALLPPGVWFCHPVSLVRVVYWSVGDLPVAIALRKPRKWFLLSLESLAASTLVEDSRSPGPFLA